MNEDADSAQILDLIAEKADVSVRRATYVSMDANKRAVVNLGTSQFSAEFATGLIPEVGEPVRVLSVDDRVLMLGPVGAKPGRGTVVSIAANIVTATTAIGTLTMPYVGSAPAVADLIAIGWSEGPYCAGKLSTTPAATPTPGAPGSANTLRSATFLATDAGSTDRSSARWWTDQPWASNSTYGAWFYGGQISDSIPAAATFVSLEFFVSYQQRQGGSPNFALHDNYTKAGVPGYATSTAWSPNDGWQVPPDPTGWFNSLKAGGGWAGIGLNQGGFNKFSSRAQDGLTGALRISWRV